MTRCKISRAFLLLPILGMYFFLPGCGEIANKDRIVIARIGSENITRGDLFKVIREMDDTERPHIRSQRDFLRVLNQYIDDKIKLPLGKEMVEQGIISLPRELAREEFFRQSGDDAQQHRTIWELELPESGEATPLMEVYNLTPATVRAAKEIIEQETDRIMEKLLGEQAVMHLAVTAYNEGSIILDQEDLEREYRFQGDNLMSFEKLVFRAIRFPASAPGALEEAGRVRQQLDDGDDFDELFEAFFRRNRVFVIESEIENNPAIQRFRGFWQAASGAETGDIIGPIYMPQSRQERIDETGRATMQEVPDYYMVLKIIEHEPEQAMSIEEAMPLIAPQLLMAEQMRRLREQHNVEIFEDRLPDPGAYYDYLEQPLA